MNFKQMRSDMLQIECRNLTLLSILNYRLTRLHPIHSKSERIHVRIQFWMHSYENEESISNLIDFSANRPRMEKLMKNLLVLKSLWAMWFSYQLNIFLFKQRSLTHAQSLLQVQRNFSVEFCPLNTCSIAVIWSIPGKPFIYIYIISNYWIGLKNNDEMQVERIIKIRKGRSNA